MQLDEGVVFLTGQALAPMSSPLTWPEVVKSAIGPFVGAGLAFASTKLHDHIKARRDNVAAVRVAIATVGDVVSDVAKYRHVLHDIVQQRARQLGEDAPRWAYAFPVHHVFKSLETIKLDSLAFLFEKEANNDLYGALSDVGRMHAWVQSLAEQLAESATQMQDKIAEAMEHYEPNEAVSLVEHRKVMGAALCYRLSDLLTTTLSAVGEETERRLLNTAKRLKEATEKRYKRAGPIALPSLLPEYSAAELPPPPRVFGQSGQGRY
jgi:hypothetical protein